MSKSNLKSSTAAPSTSSKEEFDGAKYALHLVEVVGGKKAPVGLKTECIKAAVGRFGPYALIVVEDENVFIDPKHLKVLKPMVAARAAVVEAEQEEASNAVLMVSGTIQNETEKAVLMAHFGWFKPKWFPKRFVSKVADHEDGQQTIFEITKWKLASMVGPEEIERIDGLQAGYENMLKPKAVIGKTTHIKKAK